MDLDINNSKDNFTFFGMDEAEIGKPPSSFKITLNLSKISRFYDSICEF